MSDAIREAFEKWWPFIGDSFSKRRAFEAWQAALQSTKPVTLERVEVHLPVAALVAEIGEGTWFNHLPIDPSGEEFDAIMKSPELDYCLVYTTPQPVVIPAQWRVVMRGMVEYAECNDPGNPYLPQAQALLSAGKRGE